MAPLPADRRVVELVRIHRMEAVAKDAEILVLRPSWPCCAARSARPHFTWSDRALIATLAKLVPAMASVRVEWEQRHGGNERPHEPRIPLVVSPC